MKFKSFFLLSLLFLTSCGNVVPSTTTTTTTSKTEEKVANIYGINDFHGAINASTSNMGIRKLASYLKNKKEKEDAILLNNGDFWQGSIESNFNRGKLLTTVSNYIQMDAMSIGNHEFDWDTKYIKESQEMKDAVTGYSTPILCSNVYDYDHDYKVVGDYSNLGPKYVIRELENGLKVGIIGVIGYNQIASINAVNVRNYTFVDPTKVICQLSNELKGDLGCDMVIVSAHAGQDEISEGTYDITKISSVTNKRFVDAVLCGHTHSNEYLMKNGVPFVQSSGYGMGVPYFKLTKKADDSIICSGYGNDLASTISVTEDPKISELIQPYLDECETEGKEKLTYSSVSYAAKGNNGFGCVIVSAIADYCDKKDIEYDFTFTNNARTSVSYGYLTYSKLYSAMCFDNEVIVCKVKGKDILKEFTYSDNYFYRNIDTKVVDTEEYIVAGVDYMMMHENTRRELDYFPSYKYIDKLKDDNGNMINYRDITKIYLKSFSSLPNVYKKSYDRYNPDLLKKDL